MWYAHEFQELRKLFMLGSSPSEDQEEEAEQNFVRSLSRYDLVVWSVDDGGAETVRKRLSTALAEVEMGLFYFFLSAPSEQMRPLGGTWWQVWI